MALTKVGGGVLQQPIDVGIITATNINVSGAITASSATFTGDVSIGGTITYEDVTNVDSVGLITARSGIHVIGTGSSVGIGTDNPSAILEVATSVDGEATLAIFKNISAGGTNETVDINLGLEGNTTSSNVILRAGKEANHNSGAATDNFFAIHTTLDNTSSEKLRITSSGNLGIGTDDPVGSLEVRDSKANLIVAKDGLTVKSNSDLHTSYDTLQIGAGGALLSYSVETVTADTQFVHNAYRSSGGTFKYRYADTAARIRMNSPGGEIIFDNAASGSADADITFSERLRITSSGEVGINETEPDRRLHVKSGANSNDGVIRIESANDNIMDMGTDGTGHFLNCVNTDPFRIKFAGTEKIRVGNNGTIATYQISNASTMEGVVSSRGRAGRQGLNATTYGNIFNWNWTVGGAIQAWVDTTNVGNVTYTSDYRIKRNIQDQPDTGIDRVKQLRPVTYNGANFTISEMETQISVEDNILHEGFVAHEVGEVIPDGCVGEKDSDTQIQSLNLSAIVSVVTKGLQEVIAKIETLEARITALENP